MQRLRGHQHHVVGDVDHVVDRAHAGADQPRLEPERRRPDLDVREHPGRETRAELRHLNGDRGIVRDLALAGGLGVIVPRGLRQLRSRDRVELACHPVDTEAVDPVRGRLELDHGVRNRNHLRERRSGRDSVFGQNGDSVRVVADLELGLREDHPVGLDSPQLRLSQPGPVGHHRARQRNRNRLAGGDVRRPADDRPATLPRVDLADAELVGVGVLFDRHHPAHHEGIGRWRANVGDSRDLDRVHGELVRDLLDREVGVAVGPQPALRDPHRNCSSTRTSFSKNLRRSGTPYFSIAMRSTPIPKAKPWTRSGS